MYKVTYIEYIFAFYQKGCFPYSSYSTIKKCSYSKKKPIKPLKKRQSKPDTIHTVCITTFLNYTILNSVRRSELLSKHVIGNSMLIFTFYICFLMKSLFNLELQLPTRQNSRKSSIISARSDEKTNPTLIQALQFKTIKW